jgi:hypothetical protein
MAPPLFPMLFENVVPVNVAVQLTHEIAPPVKAALWSNIELVSVNGDDVSWKMAP